MAEKVYKWKVYPAKNKRLYFRVHIHPTREIMQKHCFWMDADFEAMCTGYARTNKSRSKCIGEINFHWNALGSGIVSHEMLHAALRYLEVSGARGLSSSRKNGNTSTLEERLCFVLGWLVSQFWDNYYKIGT